MSNIQGHNISSDTVLQVIQKKYKKFKTLVLKLKSTNSHQTDLSTLNPDELDEFVDRIIIDLQENLLSNINNLRERIKQSRPDSNDTHYEEKMIVYRELLEQMISLMQKLQNVIHRTLDEYHILVGQLWNDISTNNGGNIDHLLDEHQRRIEAFMNERWIKDIHQLQQKLNSFHEID